MTHEEREPRIRVGPAGWSYDDWKGIVYPADMPRTLHPLEFLSRSFDTVEVNSSFYRPTNPKHAASWVAKVGANPNFKFAFKLWQRFTHERDTWPGATDIQLVRGGIAPVADAGKLGALLVQFPWSFKRTIENRQWLARVVDAFAPYPLAIEIRHASWDCPEVYAGLAERNVAFCNIDQPLFDDSIAPSGRVTSRVGYVRLHGRNKADWFREGAGRDDRYNYLYSHDELSEWIKRIEGIRKMVDEAYVVTNNHYRGQAVVNAFELQDGLGQPVAEVPSSLVEHYPRLKEIAGKHGAS